MTGRLNSLTRWLRLLLACLAVGSLVSPAQVASAAGPVSAAQGGPGKKPEESVVRPEALAPRRALSTAGLPQSALAWRFARFHPPADPRPSSPPRFLLHHALLN